MADDTSASALESSSAEALVTMKEGKGQMFQTGTPPRRGHPVRIRKPNPRIFGTGEEDITKVTPRPKKQPKVAIHKAMLSSPDKKAAQSIGVRLRNLLKLPKAHKWVCYEWFYSNLDRALFEGENDFCICLRESFPQLKTRSLTRMQWCKIRRLMGKPRRCSAAFFAEERGALQRKREKLRILQQRKISDLEDFKDLPEEIPMPLVIGTKVTARLRRPQDGLFIGVIDALDTVNNTYRVTFDRPGLGTYSVPDVEVLSNEAQETMPLSAFTSRQRPRQTIYSPVRFVAGLNSLGLVSDNDPLLGSSPLKEKCLPSEYGGFPIKFLVLVTRLSKILAIKKECIRDLKEMNTQAEKMVTTPELLSSDDVFGNMKSYGKPFDTHFQQQYASTVLELDRLNKDLNEYLIGIQQYYDEIPDHGGALMSQPTEVSRNCDAEAEEMVKRANLIQGRRMVKKDRILTLIGKLNSLLLQIRTFTENDMHSFEFVSLQDTLNDIKVSVDPSNITTFENCVEIHVKHIESGLSQMGNLHAFASAQSVATL
ncbi:Lin-9-like protein [Lamellibrachia satsuma]|nr:Lin-9-like protein [Lamellibrachia satsuma]